MKKKLLAEFFVFLNALKTQLIKALKALDSSTPYGRLLENKETGALGNDFCLKRFPH